MAFKGSTALSAADKTRKKLASQNPGSFNYRESGYVTDLRRQLDALQKQGAQSQWTQGVNDALNKILNRERFSYDLNGDALYQQYKDQYTTQGKMAMMDTMGQAAALTGGYGNSYAQGVGQQAYQGYLQQLNSKIPELYQLALDKYNSEGNDLQNQYALLADRENTDYSRWQDKLSALTNRYYNESDTDYTRAQDRHNSKVSDWQYRQSRADDDYANLYNREYTAYRDAAADAQYREKLAYQKEQDRISNELAIQKALSSEKSGANTSEGDVIVPVDSSAQGVRNFKASILTEEEFTRRKIGGSYRHYVRDTLEKWAASGKLTEAEAANLIGYYNF